MWFYCFLVEVRFITNGVKTNSYLSISQLFFVIISNKFFGKNMQKKYRPNVAAVILSSSYPFKCEIFVAKRVDMDDIWQFPQGGIDEGESPKQALKRELKEEIGTDKFDFLEEYPDWLSYDFPANASKRFYPFDGQTQKYFLVRLKNGASINLKTEHPEFSEYKFVDINKALEGINHFKKPIYDKVLSYFKEKGYF